MFCRGNVWKTSFTFSFEKNILSSGTVEVNGSLDVWTLRSGGFEFAQISSLDTWNFLSNTCPTPYCYQMSLYVQLKNNIQIPVVTMVPWDIQRNGVNMPWSSKWTFLIPLTFTQCSRTDKASEQTANIQYANVLGSTSIYRYSNDFKWTDGNISVHPSALSEPHKVI